MKMAKKIIYIVIGILLLTATILTGTYGLSSENIEIYSDALAMQKEMDEMGFSGFRLSDYPVAFFDGDYDYVLTATGDSYEIQRRRPVLSTYVGTAYPVDDHYEVLMPTVERFHDMMELFSSAEQLEQMSSGEALVMEESEYGKKEQIATIWHEAFHAYQSTYYMEQTVNLLEGHDFSEGDFGDGEAIIVERVDENPQVVELYKKELELLKQAVLSEDIDTIRELALEYKSLEEERQALLDEDILILERYYKQLEGTARYVEVCAYRNLYSEEAFQSRYVEPMDEYTNGSGKYYDIGMAECLILDKLNPNWQSDYDCSTDLLDYVSTMTDE